MTMLSAVTHWLRPAPPPDPDVNAGLSRIAAIAGAALSNEPGFERKLAPKVRGALDYCEELVAALPPPLVIERASFASEPHVHALFGSADDIDAMIGQSPALQDYVSSADGAGAEDCYALLAARRQEKSILGVACEGEFIRNDVPQKLLHFSNHNLSLIADNPESARLKLKLAAFDGLIKTFAAHVGRLRTEQVSLRQERAIATTRGRMAGHRGATPEVEARCSRTIASLDERLSRNADALLPRQQIEALGDFLSNPHEALHLETVALHVDRGGKIIDAPDARTAEVASLHLTELISRDRRRHVIVPVRFQRSLALQALERTRQARARFIVI